MEKSVVEKVLLRASETGADFAELFVEQGRDLNFSMGAGKVHSISSALENGAGIRLFKGDFTAYAYTNDLSEQGLMTAAERAALALNDKKLISSVNLVRQDVENKHFVKEALFSKTHGDLIDFMRQASDKLYQTSSFISRTDIGLRQKQRHILIANSEGRLVEDDRNYALYGLIAVAEKGNEKFSDCVNVGGMCGCEIFDRAFIRNTKDDGKFSLYQKKPKKRVFFLYTNSGQFSVAIIKSVQQFPSGYFPVAPDMEICPAFHKLVIPDIESIERNTLTT